MKKLIAIATADWHIHKFRNFNKDGGRLVWALNVVKDLGMVCRQNKVPLLFAGDLFHNPMEVENETLTRTLRRLNSSFGNNMFCAISGNHDMSEKNGLRNVSPTYINMLEIMQHFIKLDCSFWLNKDFIVWGIPYMNYEKELIKSIDDMRGGPKKVNNENRVKILMLHCDMPGAKTPEGFELSDSKYIPKDLDKFFKEWDIVICGHIHKPQQLSNKVFYCGSPIHQNMGDKGDYGYWRIYDDKSFEFVPLEGYPKFIRLKPGEKPYNKLDYFIEAEEILPEEDVITGDFNISKTRESLAKKYLKIKGIKGKSKKMGLVTVLNAAE